MPKKEINPKGKKGSIFLKNFIAGLGWMIGATFGFALFIGLSSLILGWLGGLPIVGEFIANLIDLTNKALETKRSLTN